MGQENVTTNKHLRRLREGFPDSRYRGKHGGKFNGPGERQRLRTAKSREQQPETTLKLLIKASGAGKDANKHAVLRPQLMIPHLAAMNYSSSH